MPSFSVLWSLKVFLFSGFTLVSQTQAVTIQPGRSCLLDLFAQGFVVWNLQILKGYARASLHALRKNLRRNHFPPN